MGLLGYRSRSSSRRIKLYSPELLLLFFFWHWTIHRNTLYNRLLSSSGNVSFGSLMETNYSIKNPPSEGLSHSSWTRKKVSCQKYQPLPRNDRTRVHPDQLESCWRQQCRKICPYNEPEGILSVTAVCIAIDSTRLSKPRRQPLTTEHIWDSIWDPQISRIMYSSVG